MPTTTDLIDRIITDIGATLTKVDPQQVQQLEAAILKAGRLFLAGKGRTGLQMRAFAMRLMHLGLTVHVVDDVTTPAITPNDLLIIGSGSGSTSSLLRYAELCDERGIPVALITGNPDSDIAKTAGVVVHIPATNFKVEGHSADSTVLVMGSLFEHSLGLVCDLIIIKLMAALNESQDAMHRRHANLE